MANVAIAKDTVVTLDYSVTDTDGELVDSSDGGDRLIYLHGAGGFIPDGLETALEGKVSGDRLDVTLAPQDAYGEWDESLVETVERSAFEGAGELTVGMQFEAEADDGTVDVVTVVEVDGDQVTVDANHVLAGLTLRFQVSVVDVRPATEEEIAHAHVHS